MTVSGGGGGVVRVGVTGGAGGRVVVGVGVGVRVVRVGDGVRVRVGDGVPVMVWVVFRPVAGGALVGGLSEALVGEDAVRISAGTAIRAPITKNTAAMTTLGNCIALSRIAVRSLGGR